MAEIIKFSNNRATGIATPRYGVQQVAQNLDPDLFINMLAKHPEHIARAKAKREQVMAERKLQMELEKAEREELERLNQKVGFLSCATTLAVTVAVALML